MSESKTMERESKRSARDAACAWIEAHHAHMRALVQAGANSRCALPCTHTTAWKTWTRVRRALGDEAYDFWPAFERALGPAADQRDEEGDDS